jgi:hypothetical protein
VETLRDKAIEAYQAKLESDKINSQKRDADDLKRLMKRNLGIDVDPDGNAVEIDGINITVARITSPYPYLHIVGTCPDCGETVLSYPIINLASLGDQLTKFKPHHTHKCKDKPTRIMTDSEAALLDALQRITNLDIAARLKARQ